MSLRCDLSDQLLLKAELHYLEGSGKVFDTIASPQPFGTRDEHWVLLALKTTCSF